MHCPPMLPPLRGLRTAPPLHAARSEHVPQALRGPEIGPGEVRNGHRRDGPEERLFGSHLQAPYGGSRAGQDTGERGHLGESPSSGTLRGTRGGRIRRPGTGWHESLQRALGGGAALLAAPSSGGPGYGQQGSGWDAGSGSVGLFGKAGLQVSGWRLALPGGLGLPGFKPCGPCSWGTAGLGQPPALRRLGSWPGCPQRWPGPHPCTRNQSPGEAQHDL